MAGDLHNVAMSFLGARDHCALSLSSSDPNFNKLKRFLNNVRISNPSSKRQRTKTIRGLIKHAGNFVFSKNDRQQSTVWVN